MVLSEAVELDAVGTAVIQLVFTAAFVPGHAKGLSLQSRSSHMEVYRFLSLSQMT